MRSKLALSFLVLLAACAALCQTPVTLEFQSERDVVAFTSAKPPTQIPSDATKGQGTSVTIDNPGTGTLYVWDRSTGNMARKPAADVAEGWRLKPVDFTLVGSVTVQVLHEGARVSAARVVLKDKLREQSQLLDESSNGEAEFVAVAPGEVRVTVEYKSGGSQATPVTQIFELDLERRQLDPVFTVSLPQEAATIGGTAPVADGATGEEKEEKTSTPNPIGSFIVYILALGAAIAAGYYGLMYIKNNPKQVSDQLQKFGVPVSDPTAGPQPGDSDPIPVAPPKPQPQQKIILDDAARAPMAATLDAPPMPISMPSEPRLVKESGEFVMLDEGELVVGREDGLGLSLLGESTVSRRHAAVIRQGGQVIVKDLGSTNGTFVNGRKVDTESVVQPGDDVQFGAVKFRLEG